MTDCLYITAPPFLYLQRAQKRVTSGVDIGIGVDVVRLRGGGGAKTNALHLQGWDMDTELQEE